jgi:hypothetical protein
MASRDYPSSEAVMLDTIAPPGVSVPGDDAPVRKTDADGLKALGYDLAKLFMQYRSDRRIAELRWLRNLRQYLGFYDPEVEKQLSPERSRAYPKMTRVKCISMQAHIMDLMFPSDDRNWTLKARPSPDMDIEDVKVAIQEATALDTAAGNQPPNPLSYDYVMAAVQTLADERAADMSTLIDDQLQELGGDQSYDYTTLNDEIVKSAILYGLGILRGPYARPVKTSIWELNAQGVPVGKTITSYMPQFEFLTIWDFYPDLAAKRLGQGDGYFTRVVMGRTQVRNLADREDFFPDVIKAYLAAHIIGNYRPEPFETELRAMGVKINVNEMKVETTKYEVIVWHGKITGNYLQMAGIDVEKDKLADEIDAEVWMIDGYIIKAAMNPWVELGVDVQTLHYFLFDSDDTSPIGFGLPNVLRDTQMSVSAATRMLLDNASVTCGPILEMNTALLRADQDLGSLMAYKTFYRDDEGPTSQWPAVRAVEIDGHIPELTQIIELFLKFMDMETFVNPMSGDNMETMPSEPMRNAAGASMLLGKASLPFKQIIRNFDRFTESVIQSLVYFNRQFNPTKAKASEYDVIARGATSLIAKEVRGMQLDQLATTLTPGEQLHVDDRKMAEARFRVRDLEDMLVSEAEAARRKASQDQAAADAAAQQKAFSEANIRELLSQVVKNISQSQKNNAAADAQSILSAVKVLETGLKGAPDESIPQQRVGTNPPAEAGGPSISAVPPGLAQLQSGSGQGLDGDGGLSGSSTPTGAGPAPV